MEVNISPSINGSWHPEWLAGIDKKPVSSGGCCRLSGRASSGRGREAEIEDSQSQSRASLQVPDGLVHHVLPVADGSGVSLRGLIPFVQRLESSSCSHYYMYYVRKAILNSSNYQLDRYFPEISGASYGDKFTYLAGPDEFTRLPSRVFWWLINIRPGYLVFQQGDSCMIESYMPSCFARQFGYDQLYVGNPNTGLRFSGNLFEGARA